MNATCKCPSGFRYHALNCPRDSGAVLNRRVNEKALREERLFDACRSGSVAVTQKGKTQ